jgi:hypothetical protein
VVPGQGEELYKEDLDWMSRSIEGKELVVKTPDFQTTGPQISKAALPYGSLTKGSSSADEYPILTRLSQKWEEMGKTVSRDQSDGNEWEVDVEETLGKKPKKEHRRSKRE